MQTRDIVIVLAASGMTSCASDARRDVGAELSGVPSAAPREAPINAPDTVAPPQFSATLNGVRIDAFEAATVTATFESAEKAWVDISWAVGHAEEGVSMVVKAPLDSLKSRELNVAIVNGAMRTDGAFANVAIGGELLADGEVRVAVEAGGRMIGAIRDGALSFSGNFAFSCVVPANMIPGAVAGPVSDESGETLITDLEFKSPRCAEARGQFQ